jgi:hypothetical protein
MRLLNEAYETLSDPQKRREYDSGRGSSNHRGRKGQDAAQRGTVEPRSFLRRFIDSEETRPQDPAQRDSPKREPAREVDAIRESYRRSTGEANVSNAELDPALEDWDSWDLAAKLLFCIGLFIFAVGHFWMIQAMPQGFFIACSIWLGLFGIPAHLCYKYQKRKGLFLIAVLFLLAGLMRIQGDNAELREYESAVERFNAQKGSNADIEFIVKYEHDHKISESESKVRRGITPDLFKK